MSLSQALNQFAQNLGRYRYDESMRGDATASQAFMAHPTYGDGGMAAAVRLRS